MEITDSCLDAETLAAWVDGGLSESELERAQTHVADCARCQALVGTLARINSAVPAAEAEPVRWRWLTWLVPLTAAAVAVAVWVVVPRSPIDQRASIPEAPAMQSQVAKTKPQAPAAQAELGAPRRSREGGQAPAATQMPARTADMRSDASLPSEVDSLKKQEATSGAMAGAVSAAPSLAAPAAPLARPQAASANALESARSADRRTEAVAGIDIVSPDPMVRWRVTGTVVQRSTNGGAAWETTPTGASTELIAAGAAPSPLVCWLVGRAGVVLLSTDGRTWRRVPFPEITDLSAVRARDAGTVSVTTTDGRIFSTNDAGSTWVPGPLQGF